MKEERTQSEKLSEAARKARNAYAREWAKKNPEKVKAAMRRHWERKAASEASEEG